ncbi:twin transmembrane helix small protein [Paracoccus sp. DMF-8]|uniref:twin transmembrane helix small protein n=1 Tax=Paracoccus sp. DMF-8 TaxID=3019445 RepID=UPI0023E4234F|nr:twin transmembrane helix small protein [Paracoccus sp. DMF-8]MDF3607985.1 twin transmembrane helix small protein [Paracoccus sp. DMF-8]
MHDKTLFILAAVLCLIVTVILAVGIGGFAKGGEFNRRHGNRMMRWRLIAQFVTIVVILGYLWIRSR